MSPDSPPAFGNLHAYDDAIVPWILAMTDGIHEHGAAGDVGLPSRIHQGRERFAIDGVTSISEPIEDPGQFVVGGQTFDVLSVAQGPDYLVEVDGAVHRISGGEAGLVRAPAPAMVVAVSVAAGDEVTEGDVVAVCFPANEKIGPGDKFIAILNTRTVTETIINKVRQSRSFLRSMRAATEAINRLVIKAKAPDTEIPCPA